MHNRKGSEDKVNLTNEGREEEKETIKESDSKNGEAFNGGLEGKWGCNKNRRRKNDNKGKKRKISREKGVNKKYKNQKDIGIEPVVIAKEASTVTTRVDVHDEREIGEFRKRKRGKNGIVEIKDKYEPSRKYQKNGLNEKRGEEVISRSKNKRVRSMIIAPKHLNGYMVTQASSKDCVVVRFREMNATVISLYCDINKDIRKSVDGICKERCSGNRMIIGADTNAHSTIWGATGGGRNRFRSYARGDLMCEIIDELDLSICNVVPHPPTFQGETGYLTHIDVMLCTSSVIERISNWRVGVQNFESDHRAIFFEINSGSRKEKSSDIIREGIAWRKPSDKMAKVVRDSLPHMVHFRRRLRVENDVNVFVQKHTEEVQEALHKLFKGKNNKEKAPCYWWTAEVSEAHSILKRAKRREHRYKYPRFIDEYNETKKNFRDKVKLAKVSTWREFTSSIDDPWKGLMKILKSKDINRSQARTLCDTKGWYSSDVSSTLKILSDQFYPDLAEYNNEQRRIEELVNKKLMNVDSGEEITKCEFRKALGEMKKAKAPGSDKITNYVLHVLAEDCKFENQYLQMYNLCLNLGIFPDMWKAAKIVLIPKETDMIDSVKAFRPISLTSVYSKLFERIVLARILYYIKLSENLAISQHAYRKGSSTTTALYEVAKFVQDTLHDKHVCIIVFLDISGAFDRTWHGGILNRLLDYGVPAYLVKWVKAFLTDRSAHFESAGDSHVKVLKQGCPQGGVLSPALWNVLFNDMLVMKTKSNQDFHLKVVGYADDAAVICRVKNVKNASVILTNYLVRIKNWADKNRVYFNQSKLNMLTIQKGLCTTPACVYFDGKLIREVQQYKYLGVIFDSKYTWKPHVLNVIDKLTKLTRMLRGVVREKWGIRLSIMRMLYKSIFCPIMLYGVVIWGWKAMRNNMCVKFNSAIRKFCLMSTRCFRTSSSEMLFKMMDTVNFSSLVKQVLRVSLLQIHLAKSESDHVYSRESMRNKRVPVSMEHFIYMCKQGLDTESLNIVYENLLHNYSVCPSEWEITHTNVKNRIDALWDNVRRTGWRIYTDASVSSYGAGCAYAVFYQGFCIKTEGYSMNKCSIFTAEVHGVINAVKYVSNLKELGEKEIVEILCDSQAVVHAIKQTIIVDPVLRMLKEELRMVAKKRINVELKWVPSHANVEGNEIADKCAKAAVDSEISHSTVWVKRDLKASIKKKVACDVQEEWEKVGTTIPRLFFPGVNNFKDFLKSSPSVELCQIVTGHCRLNAFMCNKVAAVAYMQ